MKIASTIATIFSSGVLAAAIARLIRSAVSESAQRIVARIRFSFVLK